MSSSTVTPVWGPQLPRLPRQRQKDYSLQLSPYGGQSRNGVTLVENPWVWNAPLTFKGMERCHDTIRNPKFKPFRQPNFSDDGGPLKVQKSHWTFDSQSDRTVTPWKGNTRSSYGVHVITSSPTHDGHVITSVEPPAADLDTLPYHAKAFALAKPTNPLTDLGVFLGELRDLGGLFHASLQSLKDIANYYLSIEFGWKPLLRDIMSWFTKCIKLDEQFRWLIRNNGKPVRRRVDLLSDNVSGVLSTITSIGITRNTYVDWPGRSPLVSSWGRQITWTKQTKVWASGEFIFYLGDVTLPSTEAYLKHGLLGLRLTPAVVWNLIPWSWLFDWFTNVGDVLDALSEQVAERTVSRYLYVMKETYRTYSWSGTDGWYTHNAHHNYVTKVRDIVHPFGLSFGGTLSARQLQILAALGAQKF